GRTFEGMGFSTAPGKAFTTEATEVREDFDVFLGDSAWAAELGCALALAFVLPLFAFFASSAFDAFRFLSVRAIASASHAAFTLPRVAGRLLVPSADFLSPAISPMVRPVSTEVSYASISNFGTTSSSFFLISSHSVPLLPARRALM